MDALLTELAVGVNQVLSWVGNVASTIVDTPLLLLGVVFFVLGGAIGIFGRFLSRG